MPCCGFLCHICLGTIAVTIMELRYSLPIIGPWLKSKIKRKKEDSCEHDSHLH